MISTRVITVADVFTLFTVLPKFTSALDDVTCLEFSSAVFECEMNEEDFRINWYMDGKKVTNSGKFEIEKDYCRHRLIIHNVNKDEEGTVQATSGDLKSEAKLYVEGEA